MSLAAETREAVRERPFLFDALRAGVVNYTAAARELGVDGDVDAVATALRRYADELDAYEPPDADARVSMESGLGPTAGNDPLLVVGESRYGRGGGSLTAVVARGDVSRRVLADVIGRLTAVDVAVEAAAAGSDALVVLVERRDGPSTLQVVEDSVGR